LREGEREGERERARARERESERERISESVCMFAPFLDVHQDYLDKAVLCV